MGATIQSFDFSAITEYQLPEGMQIADDDLKLDLVNVLKSFSEDFADDTDFTYDSNLIEFSSGKAQQKDVRPPNATFYASYNSHLNGNWGNGVLTGTGTAGITGGKLDLSGSLNKYLDYNADENANSQQTGCIRFKWTPKYSGAGSFQYLFTITESAGVSNNRIRIYHQNTLLFISIQDQSGGSIVSLAETFSPIAETPYEIELNWDLTSGATRLFVDGDQLGSTQTGTGTRSAAIGLVRLGKDLNLNGNADFLIDDVLIFDTVQHTSNYTPDWSNIYETIYVESSITLPEMEHTGDGIIVDFVSMTSTLTGSPKLTLQIDRSGYYYYWTGSAWVVSNGDYDQSSSISDFNSHGSELPLEGATYGQFKLHFPRSDTQNSMDLLNVNLTVELYEDSAVCLCLIPITSKKFVNASHIATILANTDIQYVLYRSTDERDYYYNGTNWVVSAGYPESNTISEIDSNIADFLDGSETESVYLKIILISTDNVSSPVLSKVFISYYIKIGYTFKNYSVPEGEWGKVLTADDIRFTFLWGIDLQASDIPVSTIDDKQLEWCVDEALETWEQELNIDIRKRIYKVNPSDSLTRSKLWREGVDYTDEEDMYDFSKQQWQNFGFMKLRHRPIISIETAELYDVLGQKILDVLDWVRLYKKPGQIAIYPKGSFTIGQGYAGASVFAAWHSMFSTNFPHGFKLEYTTGIESSDYIKEDLRRVIGMVAAINALGWIGDGLMAGFSSSSIGLDGLSESFSSTQSATSAYFGARIKSYIDQIAEFRKHNKYKYCNIPIGFIGA